METFCKTFENKDYGQLVAMRQTNEEGAPEIRIFVEPPDLDVCSVAYSYPDTDKGWDDRNKLFDNITEQVCWASVKTMFDLLDK